jgi:hypothetical protein
MLAMGKGKLGATLMLANVGKAPSKATLNQEKGGSRKGFHLLRYQGFIFTRYLVKIAGSIDP